MKIELNILAIQKWQAASLATLLRKGWSSNISQHDHMSSLQRSCYGYWNVFLPTLAQQADTFSEEILLILERNPQERDGRIHSNGGL